MDKHWEEYYKLPLEERVLIDIEKEKKLKEYYGEFYYTRLRYTDLEHRLIEYGIIKKLMSEKGEQNGRENGE